MGGPGIAFRPPMRHDGPMENPFGAPIARIGETASTMDDARALAASGAPHGSLVVADFQTKGRGRFRDRSWSGERGKYLLFTILLRLDISRGAAFPLKVGLAVCEAVERLAGRDLPPGSVKVKWPNDILLGGKKLCGILCESSGGVYYSGVGLNCARREFPEGLRHPAVSLEEALGRPVDRFDALGLILENLKRVLESDDWLPSLEARLYGLGRPLRFQEGLPGSEASVAGILRGLGPGGELVIEDSSGAGRSFVSGEVEYGGVSE
jgi:BirA family biotin operon repressor/biotin-[acetyl-CoA-carboxylase] ligase